MADGTMTGNADSNKSMLDRSPVTMPPTDTGDVAQSIVTLLYDLNMLPTKAQLDAAGGPGPFFGGPSQSVALIESGGMALSKWWAAGGSVLIGGIWLAVNKAWGTNAAVQPQLVIGAAVLSAALVLGISYLLSSDVRGRSSAMVETINARREIGTAFIHAALQGGPEILPVGGLKATILDGPESPGWQVIAMQPNVDVDKVQYLVVKGKTKKWLASEMVRFG